MRRALIVALFAIAGCGDATAPVKQISEYTQARKRWDERGFRDYVATVRAFCFCASVDPVTIIVVNDTLRSAYSTRTGQPVPLALVKTVDGVFDEVRRAIEQPAGSLNVTYDPVLGYPTEAAIDWITNAIDDEVTWTVSDVGPVFSTADATGSLRPLRRAADPRRP